MLTIPGHKGNANQNHTDSTSLILELLPFSPQTTNVGQDEGKKEPFYTSGGSVS
jgi:hypothetical protein